MTPVVGFVNTDVTSAGVLNPSATEVAQVFTLSLQQLTDPTQRSIEVLEGSGVHRHKVR